MKTILSGSALLFLALLLSDTAEAQWVKTSLPGVQGEAVYSICTGDSGLIVGTETGVFRSTDYGKLWTKINPDLPPREYNPYTWCVVRDSNNLIVGFAEPGVYMSSDNGRTWTKAGIEAGTEQTPIDIAARGNWIVGGNPSVNTYQSTDGGKSWSQVKGVDRVNAVALSDSFGVAEADTAIFISTDRGSSWEKACSISNPYLLQGAAAISGSVVLVGVSGGNTSSYVLSSRDAGADWTTGGLIDCDFVNSLVFSPPASGAGFVFAGTDSGVFRSSDEGQSWSAVNSGLGSKMVYSLAFGPGESGGDTVLFAGTGGGLYESTDYGNTWTVMGSPAEWQFTSAGSVVYAVSSNDTYTSFGSEDYNFRTAIYSSTDNGTTWNKEFSGHLEKNSRATSLVARTGSGGAVTLYACGAWYAPNFAAGNSILFSSTDDGMTWNTVYSDSGTGALVMSANPDNLLISVSTSSQGGTLLRSSDDGESWNQADSGLTLDTLTGVAQHPYFYAFASDGSKIYTASSWVYPTVKSLRLQLMLVNLLAVSDNGGLSWTQLRTPLSSSRPTTEQFYDTTSVITSIYASGSHLLVGMRAMNFYLPPYSDTAAYGGGFYQLSQGDTSCDVVDSTFMGDQVFDFAANGKNIYAATDSGVFRTTDYGTTWDDVNSGMGHANVSSLFMNSSSLFASTTNGLWVRPLSEITSVQVNPPGGNVPDKFVLDQNYPNPFNPQTTIRFSIPAPALVTLKIYDVLGQEVATLMSRRLTRGMHFVDWNAAGFASGVYFYRLEAGTYRQTRKMLLLK